MTSFGDLNLKNPSFFGYFNIHEQFKLHGQLRFITFETRHGSLVGSMFTSFVFCRPFCSPFLKTQNPLGHMKPNFMWILHGTSKTKFKLRVRLSQKLLTSVTCMKIYILNKNGNFVKETDTSGYIVV